MTGMHWSSWTPTRATGTGTYIKALPNGRHLRATVPVVLSNPVKVGNGYRFSTMTMNAGHRDSSTVNILH